MAQITHYKLGWNVATDTGRFVYEVDGDSHTHDYVLKSADFDAVARVLAIPGTHEVGTTDSGSPIVWVRR